MPLISDLATLGGILSAGVTLGGVVFHLGKLSARVDSLEGWRSNIRTDFHEVDKQLETLTTAVGTLQTVVEERTERRGGVRVVPT